MKLNYCFYGDDFEYEVSDSKAYEAVIKCVSKYERVDSDMVRRILGNFSCSDEMCEDYRADIEDEYMQEALDCYAESCRYEEDPCKYFGVPRGEI